MMLLLLACAGAPTGDDTAAPADTGPCADVPVVTYANFGEGFVLHHCQGCHASSTPDRYGAPGEVTLDTVDEVWAQKDRILLRAASEPPTMPPAASTSEDDRTRLRWWLECAEEGT